MRRRTLVRLGSGARGAVGRDALLLPRGERRRGLALRQNITPR